MTQKLIAKQINSKVIDGVFFCEHCDTETNFKFAGFEDWNLRKVCLDCSWESWQ